MCTAYSHDPLRCGALVKLDALDRDLFTSMRALPDFTETASGYDILGALDPVLNN